MAGEAINPPPYSEMIFSAIDDLKEKDGLTESVISNYIQSKCTSLPDDHATILADQLNNLVDNGELVVSNKSYARPESSIPAKRGRGRPPKFKDPAAPPVAQLVPEIKRGRGRPKKYLDGPPAAKKVKVVSEQTTARPRGRPRKVQAEVVGVEDS